MPVPGESPHQKIFLGTETTLFKITEQSVDLCIAPEEHTPQDIYLPEGGSSPRFKRNGFLQTLPFPSQAGRNADPSEDSSFYSPVGAVCRAVSGTSSERGKGRGRGTSSVISRWLRVTATREAYEGPAQRTRTSVVLQIQQGVRSVCPGDVVALYALARVCGVEWDRWRHGPSSCHTRPAFRFQGRRLYENCTASAYQ